MNHKYLALSGWKENKTKVSILIYSNRHEFKNMQLAMIA
jgi:hypothetical protein